MPDVVARQSVPSEAGRGLCSEGFRARFDSARAAEGDQRHAHDRHGDKQDSQKLAHQTEPIRRGSSDRVGLWSVRTKQQGGRRLVTIGAYIGAALAEIAGCFAFWAWLRAGKSILWLIPGMASLALFAYLLTLAEVAAAGRAYAAYGGIYITASLGWLWLVEGVRPDRWDVTGSVMCLIGMAIILYGHRAFSN